jgi:hypothetical protein
MKFINRENLPDDFFKIYWSITEIMGKDKADEYIKNVQNKNFDKFNLLFTYNNCRIYKNDRNQFKFRWVTSQNAVDLGIVKFGCGYANSISDILEEIDNHY